MPENIIIAGFTGTIGSALVKEFEKKDCGLFLINRGGIFRKEAGGREKIKIGDDPCDYRVLRDIFEKSKECIYLISSYPQDKTLDETVVEEFDTNVCLSSYFAKIAEDAKIERFIFVSTTAIFYLLDYGAEIIDEDTQCKIPNNFILDKRGSYAFSKYLAEKAVVKNISSKRLLILRPANIFGEGEKESTIISKFIRKIASGEDLEVFDWSRNFIYLEDLTKIIFNVLENRKFNGTVNIVGENNTTSLYNLAKLIKGCFPLSKSKISVNLGEKEPAIQFKTKNNFFCNFKHTSLEEGIKRIVKMYGK